MKVENLPTIPNPFTRKPFSVITFLFFSLGNLYASMKKEGKRVVPEVFTYRFLSVKNSSAPTMAIMIARAIPTPMIVIVLSTTSFVGC